MTSTRAKTQNAFTLVELLVVITIIGLLVGILVPVVRVALEQAELTRTKAWLVKIAGGCTEYCNKYNIYPGQVDLGAIGDPPKKTGSQYLAEAAMLGTEVWIGYQPDDLRTWTGKNASNGDVSIPNTILDRAGNPMPVLYFVSKVGVSGVDQYDPLQNKAYVRGNSPTPDATATVLFKDTRFTAAVPVNPGGFILIAAGKDRKYYTEDDITYPDF